MGCVGMGGMGRGGVGFEGWGWWGLAMRVARGRGRVSKTVAGAGSQRPWPGLCPADAGVQAGTGRAWCWAWTASGRGARACCWMLATTGFGSWSEAPA